MPPVVPPSGSPGGAADPRLCAVGPSAPDPVAYSCLVPLEDLLTKALPPDSGHPGPRLPPRCRAS